jgi:hypothetical protein
MVTSKWKRLEAASPLELDAWRQPPLTIHHVKAPFD